MTIQANVIERGKDGLETSDKINTSEAHCLPNNICRTACQAAARTSYTPWNIQARSLRPCFHICTQKVWSKAWSIPLWKDSKPPPHQLRAHTWSPTSSPQTILSDEATLLPGHRALPRPQNMRIPRNQIALQSNLPPALHQQPSTDPWKQRSRHTTPRHATSSSATEKLQAGSSFLPEPSALFSFSSVLQTRFSSPWYCVFNL